MSEKKNEQSDNSGKVNLMQKEENQIINGSQDQLHHNSTLFRMGQYNYQLKDDSDPNHPTTLMGKLRKKCAPLREWIANYRLEHEPSARRTRKLIYSSCAGLLGFFLIWGLFVDKKDIVLAQTPVGQTKQFVNGDSIKVDKMQYYPKNHMALFYVSTNGESSTGISPSNISTSFQMQNPPSSSATPAPTIQLLPLYQDHYVLAMKNIYSGYRSMSIQIQDKNPINYNNISQAISQDNGTQEIGSPHMGADLMTKSQVKLLSTPQTALNTDSTAKQESLMRWVHKHNYQFLIFGHQQLEDHTARGQISSHLTGEQLLIKIFKINISHSKQDLKVRLKDIKQDMNVLKGDQKKLQELHKDSSITDSDPQIEQANANIKNDKEQINNNQEDASSDQKDINQAENNMSQAMSGIMKPVEQQQNNNQPWNNGSNGR